MSEAETKSAGFHSDNREALLEEEVTALEAALALSRKRLQAMRAAASAFQGRLDLDNLLSEIIAQVSELTDCDRATLFLVDEERQELWSRVAEGINHGSAEGEPLEANDKMRIRLPLGQGVAGYVAKTGVALNLEDAYEDKRFNPDVDQVTGYRTRSLLCVPIPDPSGQPMGVIEALNKHEGSFSVEDERLLEAMSHQLSVALTDALMYEEIREKNLRLEKTSEELSRRVQELDLLVAIEHAMGSAATTEELLDIVVKRCTSLLSAGAASVAVVDARSSGIVFKAAEGEGAAGVMDVVLPPERGLIGVAIADRKAVKVPDARADPRHDKKLADAIGFIPGPLLAVPILVDGRAVGALEVMRDQGEDPFTADDERILTLLAGRVGDAMAAARRRERSRRDEQQQTIGHMLSGIVHDFKTPMTVISGYVELMAMADDAEERQESADIVLKQTDLMTSMTKELLQFARGETEILIRKVYLHSFVRDVEEMLRQLFKDRNIELKVEMTYRGAARFDEVKMKRAVMNLARNAMEAMGDKGGSFTLTISQTGDQVEIAASDTGPGLAPEIENRLFESFATHGKAGGTGLGLALVKKIVEDHHGEVRVQSVQGEGATFRLRLPL